MPLVSKLFRGDPKLEACLVSDPAHVTPGSIGPHVGKIQTALSAVGRIAISPGEKAQTLYGPTTVDAVVAFKTQWRILQSYQQTPDDIVGKRTLQKLDQLMAEREKRSVPPPAPPPPIVGAAGVLVGPLGARRRLVDDYYLNCGFETVGPGQITTSSPDHYATFEELIDILLRRAEPQQVIVNHGNPSQGLLMPFARGTQFTATGGAIFNLSELANSAEQGPLDPDSFGVRDTSALMGVPPATTIRIVNKLVALRKKRLILHFRACNIGGNRGMVSTYKAAFGAAMITFHGCRLLFVEVRPAQIKAGRSIDEFRGFANTVRRRIRVFDDPIGLLSPLALQIDDIDGHTRVATIAVIEQLLAGQAGGWAEFMVRRWRQASPSAFVMPVMWENGELTYHCPLEEGWRRKLQFV
ncbi:peptidoglycan-binding domain-containing protein [Inquilinus sp.]|uniref:peptidoglycan-binding domain-containing protein n=1 Tax=Inquilinus sp. TaxID=1932117 RepID=UPI0031D6F374